MCKGWTKPEDAHNYEKLVKEVVFPKLKEINGYHGDIFSAGMIKKRVNLL